MQCLAITAPKMAYDGRSRVKHLYSVLDAICGHELSSWRGLWWRLIEDAAKGLWEVP